MFDLAKLFICFIAFSFIGWCIEVIYRSFVENRFVNRGAFIGPICPIYGLGFILIEFLLSKYKSDPLILFLTSTVISMILEYIISYICEKIFRVRLWDYSKRSFNVDGRVSLETAIPFGLLGLLVVYILYPFSQSILNTLPNYIVFIISGILLVLFLIDLILTLNIFIKFKSTVQDVRKDSTEDINNLFKKDIYTKTPALMKRFINAYPNLRNYWNKILENISKLNDKES